MSYNNQKPSIGKRGGEFIILAIYLFGDVWEFWNVNHLLCLFLGGLGIFALIWYDDALTPRHLTLVAAILVVIAIGTDWLAPPIPPPEPWHGWLQPANEVSPPNPCALPGSVTVLIGDNAFSTSIGTFTPLSICGRAVLRVERGPNGIQLDAPIYDLNGSLVGFISKNGYKIPNTNTIDVQISGDYSTLVIHDAERNELLYFRYLNDKIIRLRGMFPCLQSNKILRIITITNESISGFPLHNSCAAGYAAGLEIN